MGFQCPLCGIEFGNDRQAFMMHLRVNNACRDYAETLLWVKGIDLEILQDRKGGSNDDSNSINPNYRNCPDDLG